jgi:endonuclease YncB( thermonuclease family)
MIHGLVGGVALCALLGLSAHAEPLSGRVVSVSDGDSITVLDSSMKQHKVRLAGIDAPERSQPFGQVSKRALSDLVFDRWVTVDTDKVDRYGRAVGKVLKDGLHQLQIGMATGGGPLQ